MVENENSNKKLTTLHTIRFFDWQREGIGTFERNRATMLTNIKQIIERIQNQNTTSELPIQHLLLAGQTIILRDIEQISPPLVALLAIFNNGGKLAIGPHYVHVNGVLVSGESLIRNLLLGQADARHYGMKLSKVAYIPVNGYHAEHLPQILRNFNIDTAILYKGIPEIPLPVRWKSPDGSDILAIAYHEHDTIQNAVKTQQLAQPDGPFIWFEPALDALQTNDDIGLEVTQSTLEAYAKDVRQALPDILRPTISGDIHLQASKHMTGTFSGRIREKQTNHRLQNELVSQVEPLLALASVYQNSIDVEQALLYYSWRLTLQNQHTIDGVCDDDVVIQTQTRSLRSRDTNQQLIKQSLETLIETKIDVESQGEQQYLIVWNPHAQPITQVIQFKLERDILLNPYKLVTPNGKEQPFGWDDEQNILSIRAEAPPLGYAVYTLHLSEKETTPQYCRKRMIQGRNISNVDGEMLSLKDGKLIWQNTELEITDLLRYVDDGDAGDTQSYRKPSTDIIVEASLTDSVQIEATATYERLILHHRLRLSPELKHGQRLRGVKALDIMTTATYYDNLPGIYFETRFNNNIKDHRLTVEVNTGIASDEVLSAGAFGIHHHQLDDKATIESDVTQGTVAIKGKKTDFVVFARALPEYHVKTIDEQTRIGLTLLRSVGWVDRDTNIAGTSTQSQGEHKFQFAVFHQNVDDASLLALHQQYQAPLKAYQTSQKPTKLTRQFMTIDDTKLSVTALKPPQTGQGWILRLFNPTDAPITTQLSPMFPLASAHQVTMAEEIKQDYDIKENKITVTISPQTAHTLLLKFKAIGAMNTQTENQVDTPQSTEDKQSSTTKTNAEKNAKEKLLTKTNDKEPQTSSKQSKAKTP